MVHRGLFITFEGPEGSGKTTLIQFLNKKINYCINNGEIKYSGTLTTREPGGENNLLAEEIRNILLNKKDACNIPNITEALLFAANRSAHVIQTIRPALENNKIVLCDRYLDSSIVYQGYVRGLGVELVTKINEFAIQGLLPDITFYLDVDPQVGLDRIKNNNRHTNRFDDENLNFHFQIAKSYKEYFANKSNVIRLDANLSIDTLVDKCIEVIKHYENKHE